MSSLKVSLAALAALVPVAAARAQVKPTISASPIPQVYQQLNIQEVLANEEIVLTFTSRVPITDTYEYELSYDAGATTQTPTVTRVRLDESIPQNLSTGTVINGAVQRFTLTPDRIICDTDPCASTSAYPGMPGAKDNFTRNIVVRVYRAAQPLEPTTSESFTWKFTLDTKPPPAPSIRSVVGGERNLDVTWDPPTPDTDVRTWEVGHCPSVPGAESSTISGLPCAEPIVEDGIPREQTSYIVSQGLANDVAAVVAVRSRDAFDNIGDYSPAVAGLPQEVSDFFELYKQQGGGESGGFCFVATAAYGSYAHPVVQVLRLFRDRVLAASPAGAVLVWSYYRASPPLAAALGRDPEARAWARAGLVPVGLGALFVLLLPLGGLLVVLSRLARRLRLPALALLLGAGIAAPAQASDSPRPDSALAIFGVGFEFRAGPYLPRLGADEGGDASFRQVYRPSPRPLFGLGAELQLYRGVGTLSLGGSFAFLQFVGKGYFARSGQRSNDTTVFNQLPLGLLLGYRFDWLADRTGIPFVPYARGGLAYHFWWITDGVGDISRFEGPDPVDPADDVKARGGKLGVQGTLGVALMLNALEPGAAKSLFEATSIRGTYLFAELNVQQVDGFGGDGFDLSDETWAVGLFFEL